MPKLWEDTVADHRRAVRDAVVDATWALVREKGLRAVTMSQIAATTGIGRATLYKYFPDVESILRERHRRMVHDHLSRLETLVAAADTPADALEPVMADYARICFHRAQHGEELTVILHDGDDRIAHDKVYAIFLELVEAAVAADRVRTDVPPRELASYILHALAGAGDLREDSGVARLVALTADGLRRRP